MNTRLDRRRAALMVIDVQEKLAAVMSEEPYGRLERNIGILAEAARRFDLPVVATEQYPKGLGATVPDVASALEPLGEAVRRLEKVEFSACDAEGFKPIWDELGRDQWILTGIECHVCVYQTTRDLVDRGATVHVVRDAVCSRKNRNWETGLSLMEKAGALLTSTETVVFDLLGKAGGDDFKALSRLVR